MKNRRRKIGAKCLSHGYSRDLHEICVRDAEPTDHRVSCIVYPVLINVCMRNLSQTSMARTNFTTYWITRHRWESEGKNKIMSYIYYHWSHANCLTLCSLRKYLLILGILIGQLNCRCRDFRDSRGLWVAFSHR